MTNPDFHYFERNGLGQAAIADAETAHTTTTSGSINTALNALGTKINEVIAALESAGVLLV